MAEKRGEWEVLGTRIVHQNPYYQVREDTVIKPNGSQGFYNVVESKGAVFIVAVDSDKNVYFEELFRYTNNNYSLEIPAGGTDGEEPLVAAKRELHEEAGLAAETWQDAGLMYPANGLLQEDNYVFIATNLSATETNDQKAEGITKIVKMPFSEALQRIKSGEITDAQTIAALTKAALALGWIAAD